ncbi:type II secretion system F family protein [Salinarimonas ramus]|uniref:Pilus assembly protein n=1 Tax=Salinarimonas ramus TaxID=690164 RepID=A0A917Q6U8_9HYPH|nr:type II secretion system F family protein [Salinarimonas ramus]GGK32863.1 pilus assembly protein [Salinarimonas ramus]
MDLTTLAVAALATASVGGVAWVFLYPILSGERRAEKRQQNLVTRSPEARLERVNTANRRDQIAQSLKELEARGLGKPQKLTLEQRLAQAGLDWTPSRFWLASAGAGVVVAILALVFSGSLVVALLAAFAGAFGLPRWVLGHLSRRRIAGFVAELPNAIDIIVRGIRSGLPLGDCLREIAFNAREPLRTEFRLVMESQAIGVPLSDAVQKLAHRIAVPEANFFAIVIGIQSKAGGNLSEALGNLSRVLRERKKMGDKVKAMSMEAKTSAAIIGALPFGVALITYFTSPDYISLLWTTLIGNIVLGVCAVWMTIGVLVMRKMINFDV